MLALLHVVSFSNKQAVGCRLYTLNGLNHISLFFPCAFPWPMQTWVITQLSMFAFTHAKSPRPSVRGKRRRSTFTFAIMRARPNTPTVNYTFISSRGEGLKAGGGSRRVHVCSSLLSHFRNLCTCIHVGALTFPYHPLTPA